MRRRVAITGVGVVSPVGTGVQAFWDALLAGRSGLGPITSFDADGMRVRIAGEVRDFDPESWLETKDVKRLDRFCHFALAAADMAVGDAELPRQGRDRVATVFGVGIGGALSAERTFDSYARGGPGRVSPFFVPSTIANMAAGYVAIRFGFGGPSACPVTACASSTDAVGMGFRLVRDGYADACLAGGAEACIRPVVMAGFGNMRALSTRNDAPQQASRPFDEDRDGFVLSEGAAALMLEPLDAARARGARVYGEVAGYGQSTDAFHETAPQPEGASLVRAIRETLADAGLRPDDVGYLNAHGTSTPLADRIESHALRVAFGDHADRVLVSSTKSMTGHLLGATGALEAAACALALRDRLAPPTINLDRPEPGCDLAFVAGAARPWEPGAALSTSMGFGGHNAALAFLPAEAA